jgi:N-acetylneuraminic acid mutarotase
MPLRQLATKFVFSVIGALVLVTGLGVSGRAALGTPRCPVYGVYTSLATLADGRVLVVVIATPTLQAKIYDPVAGRWTPASIDREAIMTPLADGRVLVIGGSQWCSLGPELYDPKTDTSSPTASMIAPDFFVYTSTLLHSGKVLVTGLAYASSPGAPLTIAELYDPATNRWSRAASMHVVRKGPRAILLGDGRVLMVGGANEVGQDQPASLTSAEIYDPVANSWSAAGEMKTNDGGRYASYVLSPLGNGMALAAGGGEDGMPSPSAELFDPATRNWSTTSRMTSARSDASGTLLPDGRVLVLGGQGVTGLQLTTGEIFDPHTNNWSLMAATLKTEHQRQVAVPLRDGRILVTGWSDHWSPADVEILDPMRAGVPPTPTAPPTGPGTWSSAPSTTLPHANHTTTLLADGRLLVLGGGFPGYPPVSSLEGAIAAGVVGEIYDPSTGRWSPTARGTGIAMSTFTATLLASGKVLVVGYGARLYDPALDRWSPAGDMAISRGYHVAIRLKDGRVLVAGGNTQIPPYDPPVEIYEPSSNSWSTAAQMDSDLARSPSDTFRAVLLGDGRVFFLNGYTAAAGIFNPTSKTWSDVRAPMRGLYSDYTIRAGYRNFSATLLSNGKVLVAGGSLDNGGTVRPEVYDPATNRWSLTPPMLHDRQGHSATLLANGLVLVSGGTDSSRVGGVTATAELFDSATNRWSLTGGMAVARSGHTATLLKNGKVLVVGGQFLANLRGVELYSPSDHRHLAGGPPSAGILHGAAIPLGIAALFIIVAAGVLAVRARGRRRST